MWGQTFTYDAYGNITKSGSISWMPGYNAATNHYQLSGTSYDADGNITNDTFNQYTWDAEGKVVSTAYRTFIYDAFGHAVEGANNGAYSGSKVRMGGFKLSAVGQTPNYSEYPFPGGSLQSFLGGATGVQLADWLGTSRAFYSYTGGGWGQSGAHAPFGEAYAYSSGYPKDFTGQENDGSMNNTTYYFPERQYRSSQGRWLSPDPAGLAAANPMNPQSWNRYAYVLNSPLGLVDPQGLDCVYLDDLGQSAETIEKDNEPPQEAASNCTNSQGYYVPGTTNSSWITVDSEYGAIGAYSVDNGIIEWTASTNNAYGVDITTVGVNVPTTNVESNVYTSSPGELSPSAQRTIRAIANAAPTICGGGAFVYGGPAVGNQAETAEGGVQGFYEWDSKAGFGSGAVVEGQLGPVGAGVLKEPGKPLEPFVFVGEGGGTIAFASGSVGVYAGTSNLGVGVYANVTTNQLCNKRGG